MNQNIVGIVGPSGTGKSTSVSSLNPKETFIINVLGKALPFKGSAKLYSTENKNLVEAHDWSKVLAAVKYVSEQRPEIKNLIIEDMGHIMGLELLSKVNETGFRKFTDVADHMTKIFNECRNSRSDLNIAFMFHDMVEVADGMIVEKRIQIPGNLLKKELSPEQILTHVLYTKVDIDPVSNKTSYKFVTNRVAGIPAKTPMGMFEDPEIPNDLSLVFNKMHEYYS